MTESSYRRRVRDELRAAGALVVAYFASPYTADGMPDVFVAHPALPGGAWVELKDGTGRTTPVQRRIIRTLREKGVTAVVLANRAGGERVEDEKGAPVVRVRPGRGANMYARGEARIKAIREAAVLLLVVNP